MEKEDIYPSGTKHETEDFAIRQKIKQVVGDSIEEIVKEETFKAFKELGYKEKDGYMYVIAAGEDGKEREVGKGVQEGKLNVTISKPKMLNMGATRPVSYMQKTTTFGGKRIISEIYMEIIDDTVHVDYKNTEASAFHQSTEKDSYAPRKLEKSATLTDVKNEASFKKKLKEFFSGIVEAEAQYLTGTKIGNSDKTEKNMNDSIIKENKYSMKLTDILSSSFEDAGSEIEKFVNESLDTDPKNKKGAGSAAVAGAKSSKDLIVGTKEEEKEEETVDEITASGEGIGGPTQPSGFKYPSPGWSANGKTPDLKANKDLGYTQVKMAESVQNTTYGMMRTARAHLIREGNGNYKLATPYTEEVEMETGYLNVPKGMEKNGEHPESGYVMGMHGKAEPNSKEELSGTGHGDLNKIEEYNNKLNLIKRKFVSLQENKDKGVDKRYIITEKLSSGDQNQRWRQLCENDCFCDIKDTKDTVSRDEYEDKAEKEFQNNNPLESNLCNTPYSGEEEGYIDVPKARGSMIVFRLSESDVRQNKTYIIDHFTKKLVLNPLCKPTE